MQAPKDRIQYLWDAYTSQKATPQEERELMEWVMNSDDDSEFRNYLQKVWNEAEPGSENGYKNWESLYERIVESDREKVIPMAPVSSRKRSIWLPITAAAVVLFCMVGAWLILSPKKDQPDSTKLVQTNETDISAPVENKAIIALADGKIISLNSLHAGLMANQGDTRLVKQSQGQIVYQKTSAEPSTVAMTNTLYNPRGSKVIDMVLSDGSHLWLNAGSSITYPVEFVGNERKVTIKGEGYFEVTHNEQKPFKVVKNGVEVTVLGTHFDVTAYDDDHSIKVSLLQGSVRVGNGLQRTLLRPGQQAQVGTGIAVKDGIDADQVVAWKNGFFSFRNTPLVEVMRQISRWYDVDIRYEGQVPQRQFGGKIRRNSSLKDALKILEESGVHYTMKGRNITILP